MRRFVQIGFLTFLIFSILANVSAQERYVRLVDEGAKDKSFSAFRVKLVEALKRKAKNICSVFSTRI